MDNCEEQSGVIVNIRTVIKTAPELLQELADRIRVRRVSLGWPQQEAAQRSGVAYRTWRRLETQGKASIEDLIKATLALRCEEALTALFAEPVAASLDDLLKRQVLAHSGMKTGRVRAKGKPKEP
jgi:transcriptional regulator with XRE-family HTH domain